MTDRIETTLFSDSGDYETWTFVKKSAVQIFQKYYTGSHVMRNYYFYCGGDSRYEEK